jgi:hypothetical protein
VVHNFIDVAWRGRSPAAAQLSATGRA